MSTATVILLIVGIAGYVAFVAFVLGLCRVAHRADEAEQRPPVLGVRTERFRSRDGDELTAGDLELLEGGERRSAREVRGP